MNYKEEIIAAVKERPRRYLTPAILYAVIMQESGGVPYFNETDKQFNINMGSAILNSSLSPNQIKTIITIPDNINGIVIDPFMAGKMAKFRFEKGYWKKFPELDPVTRFRVSCSWGISQVMGANISKTKGLQIQLFSANIKQQLSWTANELERLLRLASGDVFKMYKGYNSGNINSTNLDVINRAREVVNRLKDWKDA